MVTQFSQSSVGPASGDGHSYPSNATLIVRNSTMMPHMCVKTAGRRDIGVNRITAIAPGAFPSSLTDLYGFVNALPSSRNFMYLNRMRFIMNSVGFVAV